MPMQTMASKFLLSQQQSQENYHMKPYSDRFVSRLNYLLERVILNNRKLSVLEVKNIGN